MSYYYKEYFYRGRKIGFVDNGWGLRHFEQTIGNSELEELIDELSEETRIHMRTQAYAIYRALLAQNSDTKDYVGNEDIAIHIMNKGYHSLSEVYKKDRKVWELVKQRNLAEIIFTEKDAPISGIDDPMEPEDRVKDIPYKVEKDRLRPWYS